jgi:hypothetical protein
MSAPTILGFMQEQSKNASFSQMYLLETALNAATIGQPIPIQIQIQSTQSVQCSQSTYIPYTRNIMNYVPSEPIPIPRPETRKTP